MSHTSSLGVHILADMVGCSPDLLNDPLALENALWNASWLAGAHPLQTSFHHFSPQGVSGVVVIEESHFSIHTWPELGFASLDFFTCGSHTSPAAAMKELQNILGAKEVKTHRIDRGVNIPAQSLFNNQVLVKKQEESRDIWITERQSDVAFSMRYHHEFFIREQTEFQRIEIAHSKKFGRIMLLDGRVCLSENDLHIYHECLVAPLFFCRNEVKNLAVIGGGDEFAAHEALKSSVNRVHIFEQDKRVTYWSEKYFSKNNSRLRKDSRIQCSYCNGIEFLIANYQPFEGIIFDLLPDIKNENKFLVSQSIELIEKIGYGIIPIPSPYHYKDLFLYWVKEAREYFPMSEIHIYHTPLPTDPTGHRWFLFLGKKEIQNMKIEAYKGIYWNQETFRAAFALPSFLLNEEAFHGYNSIY